MARKQHKPQTTSRTTADWKLALAGVLNRFGGPCRLFRINDGLSEPRPLGSVISPQNTRIPLQCADRVLAMKARDLNKLVENVFFSTRPAS
jgi:hypothetical protein